MKYPPAESDAALQTYDYQLKYVNALLKQLPSDLSDPSISKPVHLQAPSTIRNSIARQGPFLFQPAPRELAGSEDREIEACDIVYLGFEDDDESSGEAERLGLVLISFKDGKIDVCFDVERIEAKWDVQQKVNQPCHRFSPLPNSNIRTWCRVLIPIYRF
jgi:nucleoporin NUP82